MPVSATRVTVPKKGSSTFGSEEFGVRFCWSGPQAPN